MKFPSAFLAILLILPACDPLDKPAAPPNNIPPPILGLWEYTGPLPDGSEGAVRVQIVEGPFMRYIGYRVPSGPLSRENYALLLRGLEAAWPNHPELLVHWNGSDFSAIGGPYDGRIFFSRQPDDSLISHHPDTEGVTLRKVPAFSPIRFPSYEAAQPTPPTPDR